MIIESLTITIIIILTIVLIIYVHYRGYMSGFKDGYYKGQENINEYVLKINHAQGEVIRNLRSNGEPP